MEKKVICFLILLCSYVNCFSQTLPDLLIKSGEFKTLPARTYNFNSLTIEHGGKLRISKGSTKWTVFWVEGNVEIHGTIEAIKHRTGARTENIVLPDGKSISHTYNNSAIGGSGGYGGNAYCNPVGQRGGIGALGTKDYGGGGGSSAGYNNPFRCKQGLHPGINARDWRGGQRALGGRTQKPGGNGGVLERDSNGGLVFIYTRGSFNGRLGIIHLYGSDGINGSSTLAVNCLDGPGPSGGGGGSPGGEGGRLICVANNYIEYPSVSVNGGIGGKGGDVLCQSGSDKRGATPGQDGEQGQDGFVDFYTLPQWEANNKLYNKVWEK